MADQQTQVSCSFSLLDEGRTYTGHHRKYLITNAREICYSPAVREKIKLREALGFYGHGRRILAGRMSLGEVEAVKLPDGGSAIVSNIPSNVTTAFDVAEDGTVTHTQEILNTETGKIVNGLHGSRVGGFSWACPGTDGGKGGVSRLSGFAGFDYVLSPGFAHNRGYVLESAEGMEQAILESVAATLNDDARAEQYVRGWMQDFQTRAAQLEDQLFESEAHQADLVSEREALTKAKADAEAARDDALAEKTALEGNIKDILETLREALPVFIPDDAMHAMLNGDFHRAKVLFESAAHIDFGQYPISLPGGESTGMPAQQQGAPEFGSAAYGERMFDERGIFEGETGAEAPKSHW